MSWSVSGNLSGSGIDRICMGWEERRLNVRVRRPDSPQWAAVSGWPKEVYLLSALDCLFSPLECDFNARVLGWPSNPLQAAFLGGLSACAGGFLVSPSTGPNPKLKEIENPQKHRRTWDRRSVKTENFSGGSVSNLVGAISIYGPVFRLSTLVEPGSFDLPGLAMKCFSRPAIDPSRR